MAHVQRGLYYKNGPQRGNSWKLEKQNVGHSEKKTKIVSNWPFPVLDTYYHLLVIIALAFFWRINLNDVDGFIVGDLCLGQPTTWPVGEEGYVQHIDTRAHCRPECTAKRSILTWKSKHITRHVFFFALKNFNAHISAHITYFEAPVFPKRKELQGSEKLQIPYLLRLLFFQTEAP